MPNEETRNRLIAEARKAFVTSGYGASSLDGIARGAGISKKTIYQYAASKADLFVAVVDDAMRPIPFSNLLAPSEDDRPEAALRDFLQASADLALSQDGLDFYRMIVREVGAFPILLPRFYEALGDYFGALVHWMERQRDRGWLTIDDPTAAASTIVSLVLAETRSGYLLGVRFAPDSEERTMFVDRAVALFLYGARPRG